MTEHRGRTVVVSCDCCGGQFTARVADRNRGWARFCSKRCKAVKQEQRTGQYAAIINSERVADIDDTHPFSDDAFAEHGP